MGKKKDSPMDILIGTLKAEKKAERSPAYTLQKIIDDYCVSREFDDYLVKHRYEIPKYISHYEDGRTGRYRCSAAGDCLQQQAFNAVVREIPEAFIAPAENKRPPTTMRALYNGTFMHLRYHMLFDALHEKGTVLTLAAEERRSNKELALSGTLDRLISFPFEGREIRAVVDYKSIKSRGFDALFKPERSHDLQQHALKLLGWEADMWIELYENKDDHSLKIYGEQYNELTLAYLKRNYAQSDEWVFEYIEDLAEGDINQERIVLPLNVDWCRYCSWEALCLLEHPDLREQQKKIGEPQEVAL